MVASPNIKTPSLSIPFKDGISQKEMDKFRLKFNRVLLSDLLEEVNVTEKVLLKPKRVRNVILRSGVYKVPYNFIFSPPIFFFKSIRPQNFSPLPLFPI